MQGIYHQMLIDKYNQQHIRIKALKDQRIPLVTYEGISNLFITYHSDSIVIDDAKISCRYFICNDHDMSVTDVWDNFSKAMMSDNEFDTENVDQMLDGNYQYMLNMEGIEDYCIVMRMYGGNTTKGYFRHPYREDVNIHVYFNHHWLYQEPNEDVRNCNAYNLDMLHACKKRLELSSIIGDKAIVYDYLLVVIASEQYLYDIELITNYAERLYLYIKKFLLDDHDDRELWYSSTAHLIMYNVYYYFVRLGYWFADYGINVRQTKKHMIYVIRCNRRKYQFNMTYEQHDKLYPYISEFISCY